MSRAAAVRAALRAYDAAIVEGDRKAQLAALAALAEARAGK